MTLIIDPQTGGIAGNMIIGALVDLGKNRELEVVNVLDDKVAI